jgi:hypothetical protein
MKTKHLWMIALGVAAFWFYRRRQAQAQARIPIANQTVPPTVAEMTYMARGSVPVDKNPWSPANQ